MVVTYRHVIILEEQIKSIVVELEVIGLLQLQPVAHVKIHHPLDVFSAHLRSQSFEYIEDELPIYLLWVEAWEIFLPLLEREQPFIHQ
jgi:hypothetical protein